jgi:hypothetical protein
VDDAELVFSKNRPCLLACLRQRDDGVAADRHEAPLLAADSEKALCAALRDADSEAR